jgi:glyoxylase-like metal-dependent hydrolase (beta-lactamase superfamily II)
MKRTMAVLAALCLELGCARAGPSPASPAAHSFRVGAIELVALADARFTVPNDGSDFGTDVGPAAVAKVLKQHGRPTDHIDLCVDALLVRDGPRLVLIDTGLGPKTGGVLQTSLAKAGVAPGAITDVLITHTHGDHAGGLLAADGALAFPNATIRMSAAEWAWLQTKGSQRLASAIAPKVRTFAPGETLAPGITAVDYSGHTPGHAGYEIVSGAARLLDIGDVAHSELLSLAMPGWTMGFDNDAAAGKARRAQVLAALARSHELVFAPHFPFPGVGRIKADGAAFAWDPATN